MKKYFATLFLLFISLPLQAAPYKGFHEGPFILLEAGVMQADFDRDVAAGENVGRNFEPAAGLLFGWDITDHWGCFLQSQYSTNKNNGRREHITNNLLAARYSFIIDQLTPSSQFSAIPYLLSGFAFRISGLPGNQNSSDSIIPSYAVGPSIGGGLTFLLKKYLYLGVQVQGDLLFYNALHQNLDLANPALANQKVYRGGFQPSFASHFMIGVHY